MNRQLSIQQLESTKEFDLCIIGGGATGLGSALDAASRGLKTILLEQYDLAKGTSSRSTKLVHGGVRYLQQGNIKLVREALHERGILLRNAPHLVHNLQFIVPNYKWWEKPFYGIGLKIYDKMAGKLGLGPSEFLSREKTLALAPTLDPNDLKGGILYHDGQFDDARLAISIAETAFEHGAAILNYFPVTGLIKNQNRVCGLIAKDHFTGKEYELRSRAVINATGVFTDAIMKMDEGGHESIIRSSRGIHIVVDKEYLPGDSAILIPKTDDGRVLFAVPWHGKTVLGTTDTPVNEVEAEPVSSEEEISFILAQIGRYLSRQPKRPDIRSVFAGLRPLVRSKLKNTAALSREHLIHVSSSGLITITGGKWTTYRRMAEDVINVAVEKNNLQASACITKELKLAGHDREAPPASIEKLSNEELVSLIKRSMQDELCMTVEDFLSRRTRQLLLDAGHAIEKAPGIASIMAAASGKDAQWIQEQITNFKTVAEKYLPTTKQNL
jgi:glycerol-3-phosphate dehydrogenase